MLEKKVWWDSEHGTEVQTVWFWETGEKQAIPQANKKLEPRVRVYRVTSSFAALTCETPDLL